tara:strand:+ start:121 stop:285 length:165 start_codon:yes stop_codon:yes gene_type:complete
VNWLKTFSIPADVIKRIIILQRSMPSRDDFDFRIKLDKKRPVKVTLKDKDLLIG